MGRARSAAIMMAALMLACAARAQPSAEDEAWWRCPPGGVDPGPAAPESVQHIEGYTSLHSYAPGDTVRFHVSTNSPTYSVEISRMQMPWWTHDFVYATYSGIPGASYQTPPEGWLGAGWPVGFEAVVGADWPSGCYVAKFTTEQGPYSYHPFVVRPREPGRDNRLVMIANFCTLDAYNDWGGRSFYTETRTYRGSMLRPFKGAEGLGRSQWLFRMLCHLEELGYSMDYITEWDVEQDPKILRNYDVVVLAGHHEYVTSRFYDAIQDHHDRGGHLASFDADGMYWQVRWEDDGDTLVGYKEHAEEFDPLYGRLNCMVTTAFGSPIVNRSAAAVRGIQRSNLYQYFETGDYTMAAEDHWIFEGTGVHDGEVFGTLMAAAEQDTVILDISPRVDILLHGVRDKIDPAAPPPPVAVAHMYAAYFADTPEYGFPEGNGGMVFTAGSITGWIRTLYDRDTGWMVKLATTNLLDRMLATPPPPPGQGPVPKFCNDCPADMNLDDRLDSLDVLMFLSAWAQGSPAADWNHDGLIDSRDVLFFLTDWTLGCP